VCRLFCQGYTIHEIREQMAERFGEIRREEPYAILSYAASRGWLEFRPPVDYEYSQFLREHYPWLADVEVVHSPMSEDVAQRGAQMLLRIVQQKVARDPDKRETLRVGFAGGVAVAHLASAFADLLCRPTPGLPKKIVFHSIVAGLSPTDPLTDPNAFFTYYVNRPLLRVKVEFLGLHAPAITNSDDMQKILAQREVQFACKSAKELDVIVTSGSDWADKHSLLAAQMRDWDAPGFERLRELGVQGDIMWRPVSASGAIEDRTTLRALTLKDLEDLPGFIGRGGSVLLTMGPCAGCRKPKGRITRILLDLPDRVFTHLVIDSLSADELVSAIRGPAGEGAQRGRRRSAATTTRRRRTQAGSAKSTV